MSRPHCTEDENQISGSPACFHYRAQAGWAADGLPSSCHVGRARQAGLLGGGPQSELWPARPPPAARSQLCPPHPKLRLRRREQTELSQAALLDQECYEDSHLGGYRRIYPGPDTEKYTPFFKHSGSLFQETAASKAREECARYLAPPAPLSAWVGMDPDADLLPSRAEGCQMPEERGTDLRSLLVLVAQFRRCPIFPRSPLPSVPQTDHQFPALF